MMRSLFAGVAGLRNHQTKMDVIGNNIANVNTAGFKRGRVNFQEMLVQTVRGASAPQGGRGGVNAQQIGLGVQVATVDSVQTQGNLQSTGKMTDIALQGDGFFILSDGPDQLYTRTGALDLDQDGNLIFASNGMKVMGWTTVDSFGKIQTNTSLTAITVPIGQSMKPQATEAVTYANNLDASAKAGTVHQTRTEVYDSVGNPHTVVLNFEKGVTDADGNTTWYYSHQLASTDPLIQNFLTQFPTYDSLLPGGVGDDPLGPMDAPKTQYQILQLAQRAAFLQNSPEVMQDGKYITADTKFSDLSTEMQAEVNSLMTAGQFEALDTAAKKLYVIDAAYNAVMAKQAQATKVAAGNTDPDILPYATSVYNLNGSPGAFTGASYTMNLYRPDWTGPTKQLFISSDSDPSGTVAINFNEVPAGSKMFTATINFGAASNDATDTIMAVDTDAITITDGTTQVFSGQWFDTATTPTNSMEFIAAVLSGQKQLGMDKLNPQYGKIIFDQSGQLLADETRTANYIFDTTKTVNLTRAYSFSPSGAKKVSVRPDFKELTQYVSPFTAGATKQNGNPAGTLQSFTIDKNGTISGVFSNGFTKDIGVIAIANFNNPGGLLKVGDSIFKKSNNSGLAQIGQANTGGRGSMSPGALEMSNVDLSQEFTDMIVTQRGFQANSRIITTSDEMLQELVNLKR